MAPSAGGTDTFSSDSVNQLNTFLGLASKNVYGGSPQCLINAATASWGEPVCGDGLRQDGEDCDCGADDCSAVDSCCNGATCTFKSGATCSALDACCNSGTCKSESKGTTCRGAASECDIKETCDGVAPTCSTDIFHYPGASCSDGITSDGGRCYLGACGSAAKQCAVDITSQYDGTYANVDSQDNDPCGTLRCSTGGASSNKYSYFPAVDGDGNLHVADGSPCKTAGIQTGGQCFNKECVLPAALAPTAVCGNQKVEPGEECDDPNDKCCNAATCKLTAAAVCSPSQGNCCDANTCQPKSASTTCRASTGECDVSEKCTGTSGRCPADEAVLMGTTCGNMLFDAGSGHTGSCFSGTCVTFKSQCVDTYGSSKTSCPQWAMLSWGGDPNKKKTKCDRLYCRDASATGSSVSCSTSSKPALQGSRCSAPEDNMFCDAAGECVAGPAKASDCNTATEFFDAGRGKCTACHSRCSGGCNGGSSAADCKNCATGSMRVGGFCVEGTSGKTCTCDNGVEAQGSACPADGAKVCASCTGNFFLQSGACKSWTDCNALGKTTTSAASNAANAVCGADKQCTCSNGNGAKGTACTTNGNAQCASCTGSFYLKNGACSQWTNCNSLGKTTTTGATNSNDAVCGADKQCTCPDGAGTKGTSCPSNGASLCASCAGSFFLKQGACNPWTVNCDVLGKVEATAATNSADAVCGADKTCLCATGSATTGTSCPTNGATSCRDADTGGGGSGFNWGGACSDGSGEFKQAIVKDSTVTVGTIPKDKADVEIVLTSTKDVDIQLVDEGKTPAKEIVAWPNGIVNGAGEESVSYESVAVKYSGYNGVNGKQGNEYIHLGKGSQTNRPLVMRAFGYAAGEATVKYSWKAPTDCVDAGCGDFEQLIQSKAVVDVGKIPAGKQSVKIYLYSAVDVDVQLHDTASGKEIIAWPNGLLNGGTQGCVTHEGLEYCYSGYNGAGGKLGNEYILVKGITNREVTMKAFGYASGSAIIEYGWGDATDCGRACCSKPATSAMQVGVVETKRTPLRTISNTPAASSAIPAPAETGNGVAGQSGTTNGGGEGSSIVVVVLTGVGGLVVGAAAMALGSVFMRRRGASRAEAPAVEMQGNPMGDNTATV